MPSTGEATRDNFSTDIQPSLFMDNWGVDVVAEHGAKVASEIHDWL